METAAVAQTQEMSPVTMIIYLAVLVLTIVANWKIYTKAGVPGWACLIPFYGVYKYFQIAGMNGWMFLLLCIPIVNIVVLFIVENKIAKAFGKGTGFGIGLVLLPTIFQCILGFGSAEYVGPEQA